MSSATQPSDEPHTLAIYTATRKRRKAKRLKQQHFGEIKELNITPMLDLMTIILVFLLMNFASSSENVNVANLTLPYSSAKLPIEQALTLIVSKDGILVDQKLVARFDANGNFDKDDLPEGEGSYLVMPLYDALQTRSDYYKRIEENGGSQFQGRIAIIADKNLPYAVIFRILYTAGRAEFGRFKLFVQKP